MEQATLPERLAALQARNGAFRCRIVYGDTGGDDLNGFATALVLRHLRALPRLPGLGLVRSRALDYLESCASLRIPGAFGFWPARERPAWAAKIPDDTDDTAIINLELAIHGRRSVEEVRRVVSEVLVPNLLTDLPVPSPPWLLPMVFPTWLGVNSGRNIVDCCVNVNVTALMSWAGQKELPGYREACRLVEAGLEWAGESAERLKTLTPYYPHPEELFHALDHAVSCGVVELQPSLGRVQALLARHSSSPHFATLAGAVCGNAYGGPYWVCPALDLVRGERRR